MSEVMEKVKERPILFSGEMVRAILAGNKTMTRRVMKPQPVKAEGLADDGNDLWIWAERKRYGAVTSWAEPDTMTDKWALDTCPYGKVGDRLWVRETWLYVGPGSGSELPCAIEETKDPINHKIENVWYRATRPDDSLRWKPSIFMPRWASRILLEVTDVRVEKLHDIRVAVGEVEMEGLRFDPMIPTFAYKLNTFAALWDKINKARGYGWAENPWVWVVEFKRIEGGV